MLVLTQAGFDVSDALRVFIELVGVLSGQAPFYAGQILSERVQHAPFLEQHFLAVFEGSILCRKKFMKGEDRVVVAGEWFSMFIPRQ